MTSDGGKNPSRARGSGSIFQKPNSRTWTIAYYKYDPKKGRKIQVREYTTLTDRNRAQKLLNRRLTQVDRGEPFEIRSRAARIEELYTALRDHYLINGRAEAAQRLGWQWNDHLKPVFGAMYAASLTTDDVRRYTKERREENASNATINRELGALRRMFNLGRQGTPPKVIVVPYIPFLKEDNVRRGFVEDAAFTRLAAEASELWLRTFLELAFTYGWRKRELLGLRVRQVNVDQRSIRLDPGTTKNREGREVAMTAKVAELLRLAIAGKKADDFVLTRGRKNNKPVLDVRAAWRAMCVRAGAGELVCRECGEPWEKKKCAKCGSRNRKYRGLIPHDLRRSAAKALRRAGVPESVIMAAGGWKTPAMFRRYAIVSTADQRDAVEMLERARAAEKSATNPETNPLAAKPPISRTATREAKPQ
jgi:integrase